MSNIAKLRRDARRRRHARVRKVVSGTPERPRLSVFRSTRHIYAQLIDDVAGETLAAASTVMREAREGAGHGATVEGAAFVGRLLAERAREKGIVRATFDRGGYRYHGRVRALAEAAREAGLDLGPSREAKRKALGRAAKEALSEQSGKKSKKKKKGKKSA